MALRVAAIFASRRDWISYFGRKLGYVLAELNLSRRYLSPYAAMAFRLAVKVVRAEVWLFLL